jgi:hypothetical protein
MYPDFRLHQAVNIFAINLESHGLDARTLAFQPIRNRRLETAALRPSQIHTQQHLRPILALRTARAGMYGDDGAASVVLAGEQHGRFQALQQVGVNLGVALDIGLNVFTLARQFEHGVEIVGHGADALVVGDGLLQLLAFLHDLLALLGLIPEVGRGDLVFGFG